MKESQGCQLQPADHWPEGQSQKQWVKNSCPDLPKYLDTKTEPQPLKESGEYQVREHQRRGLRGGTKVESPRRDVQNSRQGIESCLMDTL